jgi:transposase
MEACGSAHYWARKIAALNQGHEVKLIAAQFVRPFVRSNKTDVADAQAIWEAARQPGRAFVAVKSAEQQAILSLHRMREQLVKIRTMQVNQLRGLLYEFGEALPQGRQRFMKEVGGALARLEEELPAMLWHSLQEQLAGLRRLEDEIHQLEKRIQIWLQADSDCQRIATIPGVGLLTASAAVATIGNVEVFKSGREFAAYLGLVPGQTGTGGKVRLLGISKRGDKYVRKLLIHGARSVLNHSKELEPGLQALLKRRPKNVVAVALANKMARTIWALLKHEREYQKGYVSKQAA